MAKSVEKEAKTVEDAIALALDELNIELEDADVEIITEGSRAVLGIFGGKGAKVRVTVNISDEKKIRNFINSIISTMGIDAEIEITEDSESISVQIFGENVGNLIGRHGDTLHSITYLTNLILNKDREQYKRVVVDVENYRKMREASLIAMANRAADRVAKYKRPISLDPMPAYERRIIHTALQSHKLVETASQGEEPYRCVVIKVKQYTRAI